MQLPISSSNLNSEFQKIRSFYSEKKSILKIKHLDDEVEDLELDYINRFQPCSYMGEEKNLLQHYRSIDVDLYEKMLMSEFQNPSLMKFTSCLVGSLETNVEMISHQSRLREVLIDLKRIGKESVSGYAIEGSFIKVNGMFILKAPKTNRTSLTHEIFIGLFGTNRLRSLIPNFAYVYGHFNCSSPVFKNKKVRSFCNADKSQVEYIVYENIKDSPTFGDYFKDNDDFEDFRRLYLQVLLVLLLAYEEIGFSHKDLHGSNVLIRDTPDKEDIILEFRLKGKPIYLKTNKIVTLIDFGLSSVSFEGKTFGYNKPYLYKSGTFGSDSFPLGDAYKLLVNIASSKLKNNERNSLMSISRILEFFTNDPIEHFLREQNKNFFTLPTFKSLMGTDALENLISKVINIDSFRNKDFLSNTHDKNYKIFRCDGNCSSEVDLFSILGLQRDPEISTLVDYYDYLNSGGEFRISDEDLKTLVSENVNKINDEIDKLYHQIEKFDDQFGVIDKVVNYSSFGLNISVYEDINLSLSTGIMLRDSLFFKFAALRYILMNFYPGSEKDLEKIEDYSSIIANTLKAMIGIYQEQVIAVHEEIMEIKIGDPNLYQDKFAKKGAPYQWYIDERFKGDFVNINIDQIKILQPKPGRFTLF